MAVSSLPPTWRLRRTCLHLSYSMTITRPLDTITSIRSSQGTFTLQLSRHARRTKNKPADKAASLVAILPQRGSNESDFWRCGAHPLVRSPPFPRYFRTSEIRDHRRCPTSYQNFLEASDRFRPIKLPGTISTTPTTLSDTPSDVNSRLPQT